MSSVRKRKISELWGRIRHSNSFHKTLTFLIFVAIAALFWFILALNDNIQDNLEVEVRIENIPDSVTFITEPPVDIHVMVRDKGTNLLRNGVFAHPVMSFNFRDYAENGVMKVSRSEMDGALKNTFGSTATIISSSLDSLRLLYTTLPGKRVPVDISAEITSIPGKIISRIALDPTNVTVYSIGEVLDTLTRVFTEKIVQRSLEESKTVPVKVQNIPGVRIEPRTLNVIIELEQLVIKESSITINVENAPPGTDLLLFPPKVNVEYYVPLSKFNSPSQDIHLWVDYRDIDPAVASIPVHSGPLPKDMFNLTLKEDRVDYVITHD